MIKKLSNERVFVGDIIITKDTFRPKNKSGKDVDLYAEKYRGVVVIRRGNHYGVRFGEGLEFTNHLDGLLKKPVGYLLERDEFEVDANV